MNYDNDQHIQTDIEALRSEQPRGDAKGELVLKLTQQGKTYKMSTLKKASIPTLITALAVVGGVFMAQPKTVAATPSLVAAALKKAMNYTINSFVIGDGARTLQSTTTVNGKDKKTQFFSSNGKPIDREAFVHVVNGKGVDFKPGADAPLVIGHAPDGAKTTMKGESFVVHMGDAKHAKDVPMHGKVEVSVQNINGVETKVYKVNGKVVDHLPKELEDKIKVMTSAGKGAMKGTADVQVRLGSEGAARSATSTAVIASSLGTKGGKPMILQSGQTPSEYLVDLLSDESRWNMTRGVSFKGQKLDLFTLKMPMEPIQLYVDPATALPKFLIFKGMGGMTTQIEDVYEYNARP